MESKMNTADQELISKVITEFQKESILSGAQLEKLNKCLVDGKITPEDWYLIFESELLNKHTKI
jgi:hypothetical protein